MLARSNSSLLTPALSALGSSTAASLLARSSTVICGGSCDFRPLHSRAGSVSMLTPLMPSSTPTSSITGSLVPSRGFASPAAQGGGAASKLSGNAKAKLEKEKRLKKRKAKLMQIKVRSGPSFSIDEAIRLVKASATAAFDETIDIQVQLGVDPRKPGQNIRGIAQLPYGTGKAVSIAVFAKGMKAEEAKAAGATLVGAEDLVDKISKGEIAAGPPAFNKTIATPDVMPIVGKIARLLGPRGLMPNPKLGTVTLNLKEAIAAAKKGQAEYRCEKRGIVMTGVGKASFPLEHLKENIRSLLLSIGDAKPEGLKGAYIRSVYLRATMGPAIPVDLTTADPSSARFMASGSGSSVEAAVGTAAAAGAAAAAAAMPPPTAVASAAAAALT